VIGCAYGVLKGLRERPDVVYARTYVGGLIGRQISRTLRRPLVFHNEGFWPDEQVDAGKWTSTSRPYRLCKQWENALYREADGIVTLSQWAQQKVIELRPHHAEETVVIVPSCVDLQQFSPLRDKEKAMAVADGCRLVYAGSLGGRYPVGEVAEFLKAARTIMPNSTLRLYSQQPYEEVAPEFEQRDISSEAWSVEFVHYSQVSQALGACHAGLHFLRPGINRRAGSPTKIGEYWACGLPVVTSPHVSDGVLIAEDSTHAAEEAAAALKELLQDPELSLRCRYAAERYYNLESGVTKQINLFRHVMKLPAS
jgi:glycosyltransferase involved in cell wall biosynthesis